MDETVRNTNLGDLEPYVAERIKDILRRMKARKYKLVSHKLTEDAFFDPMVFETKRSKARQQYLYGQGRTFWQCMRAGMNPVAARRYAQPRGKVVTRTLKSKHCVGKAVDIVSKSCMWSHPLFFDALEEEARMEGMASLGFERCHIEWRG